MKGVILNKDRQLNNIEGVLKRPTLSISGVGWLVTVLPSSSREESLGDYFICNFLN